MLLHVAWFECIGQTQQAHLKLVIPGTKKPEVVIKNWGGRKETDSGRELKEAKR